MGQDLKQDKGKNRKGKNQLGIKHLQIVALLMIQFMIFLPISHSLGMSHEANPAIDVNETYARIEWRTNKPATSQVDFGKTQTLSPGIVDPAFKTDHAVELAGLDPNTRYYFQLVSVAEDGDYRVDNNYNLFYSFITQRFQDYAPPQISNVSLRDLTQSTALISWVTNEEATTEVFYGIANTSEHATVPGYVENHIASIPAVEGNQYYYRVGSCDIAGNCINSSVFSFVGGADISPPTIDVDIPRYDSNGVIDIIGATERYSEVTLYINGAKKRIAPRSTVGASGLFRFRNVYLTGTDSTIKLVAVDQVGNTAEETYQVTVDSSPPLLSITSIPTVTASSTVQVTGTVSEASTIAFQVVVDKDDVAPSKVQNLNAALGVADTAFLSWNHVSASDLEEYAVYRNGIRIAVTDKDNYTDTGVSEMTDYAYRVAAVDMSCNEGAKSDSSAMTIPLGAGNIVPVISDIELTCETRIDKIDATGSFTHTLQLAGEGANNIVITAYDRAGNKDDVVKDVLKDSAAPVIIQHNLVGLQTVYSRTVRIKGKVSENATVLIYIDNESSPSESVLTAEDGSFEKDILLHLAPDASLEVTDVSVAAGTGQGWKHHVKIVAKDIVGVESAAVEGDIIYTFCGEGNWLTITSATGDQLAAGVTPDELSPILLRNGQAEMAFTINLSYIGQGQANVRGISVRWAPQPAGQKGLDDREWFQPPRLRCNQQKTQCLVLLQANAVDIDPDGELTNFEKDELISNHRQGECIYGVGGTLGELYGCVKLPLIIEVNLQETLASNQFAGTATQTLSGGVTESHVQKTCFDINMAIGRRIPTDKIPEHFLKEMIRWSDNAIELIDNILEPLETIKQVVFYSCIASWAALYLTKIWQLYSCDISRYVSAVGGGEFEKAVAEIGKCDDVYPKDDNEEANDNCNSCRKAIKTHLDLRDIQRGLCDRIFCLSAPTLRKYISESKSKTLTPVEGTEWFSGPSCKLVGGAESKEVTIDDIEKVYSDYLKVEDATGDAGDECSGPHPADPKCCGQEYLDEYGTVCGLGQELFYNELKESVCFEKEANNRHGKSLNGGGTINCHILGEVGEALGGVLDTFSSILRCEPGAQPAPTLINTPFAYNLDRTGLQGISDDGKVYYRIKQAKTDDQRAQVWRGYTTKKKEIKENVGNAVIHSNEVFVAMEDVTKYFGDKGAKSASGLNGFKGDLSSAAQNYEKVKAEKLYEEIWSKLGYELQDILVDPTSGFLKTIQCLCLSGIADYLDHYRTMLQMVRGCFAQILITGSGNEGVCEAVLSQVVCDLIYDVISCVTKLVPSVSKLGGERGGTFSDISSFISAVGTAASEVSTEVSGRYGDSGMYNAMFNEKKLINSICMWAFTGTWDMNFEAMLEAGSDVGIAINSTGFLWPCERRFITPNPTSSPPGLATWNYHFGIGFVAGADLRYNLKLKCSNDYTCDPSDGFSGRRCDCVGREEQTRTVSGNVPGLGDGTLKKGETIGTEGTGNIYYKLEAPVRYDTAILEWEYKNNQGNTVTGSKSCDISQVGAGAPGYCQFDIGAGMFRCGIGVIEEHWARFVYQPSPNYQGNSTGFLLDETMDFTVDIQQKLPQTREGCYGECVWTKYLTYVIKTHTGRVIANNTQEITDPRLKLNTDGEIVMNVPQGYKIDRLYFAPQVGAGSFNFEVLAGDSIGPITTPMAGLRNITTARHWIIEFKVSSTNIVTYKTYSALKGAGYNNYTKGSLIGAGTMSQSSNQMTITRAGQSVAFLSFAQGGKPGSDTTAVLSYFPPTREDTCARHIDIPATWTATFTIWNSEQLAGSIYQRSQVKATDLQGALQEHTIPFKVYCAQDAPVVAGPAAIPAAVPTPDPIEITMPSLVLKNIAVPTQAVGSSVNERGYELRTFNPVNATIKFKNPPSYFAGFLKPQMVVNPYIIVYGTEFYVSKGIDLKCTYGLDVECEIFVNDIIESQVYNGNPENFTFAIRAFPQADSSGLSLYGLDTSKSYYRVFKVTG